ncbi:hypothetical protein [Kitasatospora sp. DSM 101779]|uniref:hypothetical protein n=1 Tax=Kitasatospora sp. DSM 101779 TaxID=2853165 RepID=UPI0021DB092E|nr:hypothetical protein [Kitasatospora sp. DSM 101779]
MIVLAAGALTGADPHGHRLYRDPEGDRIYAAVQAGATPGASASAVLRRLDLEAYLADLLRSRERLVAVIDADAWAKAEAMPSDEEIRRARRLIGRVKDSVDGLSEQERTEIEQATALVRRARNDVVHLGLPSVRQPLVDFRPDRTP